MEGAILNSEDHERIATLAAVKTFGLIKDYLTPKEEKIKTNRSYNRIELSELFNVTTKTIDNWYSEDKNCLLKKVAGISKLYTGKSVKAEFERRNGKN